MNRRNILPPVYNERRLRECTSPVPSTSQMESSENPVANVISDVENVAELSGRNTGQENIYGELDDIIDYDDEHLVYDEIFKFEVENSESDFATVSGILADDSDAIVDQEPETVTKDELHHDSLDSHRVAVPVQGAELMRIGIKRAGATLVGTELIAQNAKTDFSGVNTVSCTTDLPNIARKIYKSCGMSWTVEDLNSASAQVANETNGMTECAPIVSSKHPDYTIGTPRKDLLEADEIPVNVSANAEVVVETAETTQNDPIGANETEANESDDLIITEPMEWPKPRRYNLEGLVKKEDDKFSGNLSFVQKVLGRM